MRASRSGFYRRRDGEERMWLSATDIEATMENALSKAGVFPTDERPAADMERFVQGLDARMDLHANLDAATLGQTEFYSDRPPKIFINRDLTGLAYEDDTPLGTRGRWRATIAHEASHVVLHRVLFEINRDQSKLFRLEKRAEPQRLMRCLKKNVLFRGGGGNDWREVQANIGMAAALMPQSLFLRLASRTIEDYGLKAGALTAGSVPAATLTARMAGLFEISKQAAGIRLESLGIVSSPNQPWLVR